MPKHASSQIEQYRDSTNRVGVHHGYVRFAVAVEIAADEGESERAVEIVMRCLEGSISLTQQKRNLAHSVVGVIRGRYYIRDAVLVKIADNSIVPARSPIFARHPTHSRQRVHYGEVNRVGTSTAGRGICNRNGRGPYRRNIAGGN